MASKEFKHPQLPELQVEIARKTGFPLHMGDARQQLFAAEAIHLGEQSGKVSGTEALPIGRRRRHDSAFLQFMGLSKV